MKEGTHFDLPIALGILCEMEIISQETINDYIVMGELGLDGSLMSVPGILPASLKASMLKMGIICPKEQGSEAAWALDKMIIAAPDIISIINHFKQNQFISMPEKELLEESSNYIDFKDIKGQENAKRAIEIAAAGGHNVLMVGPPGCGKSMLAEAINGILPPLTSEEILEISMIYSISGLIKEGKLISKRQFRKPHHSTTMAGMIGSGSSSGKARPGEISFAHNGVLFLDELPEFQRDTLDSLRLPIETGKVLIARANSHVTYPSKFQLITAMNPCRCGYLGTAGLECSRAPRCGEEYMSKVSGPFLDRIDLHIQMQAVSFDKMVEFNNDNIEDSKTIARRVKKALDMQKQRYKEFGFSKNADIDGATLEKNIALDDGSKMVINDFAKKVDFSARSYHRALKVARTIADLELSETVKRHHVLESFSYRKINYKSFIKV
ncbi:MAG: Competence protein ComM [Alphaproteobacteria bacterium ADurb.Bin438]|nr:MAG: Competence protein ComM [Alphaproteobacteria bacterium ADurb.Bin438]